MLSLWKEGGHRNKMNKTQEGWLSFTLLYNETIECDECGKFLKQQDIFLHVSDTEIDEILCTKCMKKRK